MFQDGTKQTVMYTQWYRMVSLILIDKEPIINDALKSNNLSRMKMMDMYLRLNSEALNFKILYLINQPVIAIH